MVSPKRCIREDCARGPLLEGDHVDDRGSQLGWCCDNGICFVGER